VSSRKGVQPVKTCATYSQSFSSETSRGRKNEMKLADPGLPGEMAVKMEVKVS